LVGQARSRVASSSWQVRSDKKDRDRMEEIALLDHGRAKPSTKWVGPG